MVARVQAASVNATAATDKSAAPKPSASAAARLVFLPGVTVQGNKWYLIAVTRAADGHTKRWEKTVIGSTEGIEGVYKIVTVLRPLGRWAEDEYWPWFQRTILLQTEGNVTG
ncbi:hypothetical protein Ct61P_15106 [Colletotrichum tofieldiae]|nr:hypothetical protein Ct61P_15106 [Colletotrichum tofieldiae]